MEKRCIPSPVSFKNLINNQKCNNAQTAITQVSLMCLVTKKFQHWTGKAQSPFTTQFQCPIPTFKTLFSYTEINTPLAGREANTHTPRMHLKKKVHMDQLQLKFTSIYTPWKNDSDWYSGMKKQMTGCPLGTCALAMGDSASRAWLFAHASDVWEYLFAHGEIQPVQKACTRDMYHVSHI